MTRDRLITALLLAALFAIAFANDRPDRPAFATRASGDTRYGGYAAWYELERREGVAVSRFRSRHRYLSRFGIDTLVVALPAAPVAVALDADERTALQEWVFSGGRAVLLGRVPDLVTPHAGGTPAPPLRGAWSAFVPALLPGDDLRLPVELQRSARVLLADGRGPIVAAVRYGRGTFVEAADAAPFENRNLGRAATARLAYLLAKPVRPGGIVAFDEAVRGDVAGVPWYSGLTVPELVSLSLVAFALLLWFASGSRRLGPPVGAFPPREPTSVEFIDALATLYARANVRDYAAGVLAAGARRALDATVSTPEVAVLRRRVAMAAIAGVPDDAAFVELARVTHTARQETMRGKDVRSDRPAARRDRRGGGRR